MEEKGLTVADAIALRDSNGVFLLFIDGASLVVCSIILLFLTLNISNSY